MTLKDELRQLNIDMKYGGKAYKTYYRLGLTMPFLYHISKDKIGNLQYITELADTNKIDPIKDREALNKINGIFKDYIDLSFINDMLNLDWFDSLIYTLEGEGYINDTPVNFYLNYKEVFIKYCEFILGKNDYNFEPTDADKAYAQPIAESYARQELEEVFNLDT